MQESFKGFIPLGSSCVIVNAIEENTDAIVGVYYLDIPQKSSIPSPFNMMILYDSLEMQW